MQAITFVPSRHPPGVKLYEVQSREEGSKLFTVYVPTETPYDIAAQTPWNYVVNGEELSEEGAREGENA